MRDGTRLGLRVRVEDGKLVALVLEEPHLGVDVELVAVGRGEAVPSADVPLGDAVREDDEAAALVRCLFLGVCPELDPDRVPDYHRTNASGVTTRGSSPSTARCRRRARSRRRGTSSRRRRGRRRRPTLRQLVGDPPRDVHDRAGGDSREDALAVEQRAHRGHRLGVRDEQLAVELRDVEDRRHVAVLERAQAHHRVARPAARRRRSRRRDTSRGRGRAVPINVPPVPRPATTASTRGRSRTISAPVPS